jgi:hypothetical protein
MPRTKKSSTKGRSQSKSSRRMETMGEMPEMPLRAIGVRRTTKIAKSAPRMGGAKKRAIGARKTTVVVVKGGGARAGGVAKKRRAARRGRTSAKKK